MKKFYLFITLSFLSFSVLFAQESCHNNLFEQLANLNVEWNKQQNCDYLFNEPAKDISHHELLIEHLKNVIKHLQNQDVSHLSAELQATRTKNLDILNRYLKREVFPLDFHNLKKPYFIDDVGTHCAVGFLMKETGAGDIAKLIAANENYDLVAEIEEPRLLEWQATSGFSVDELALIQFPMYVSCDYIGLTEIHYDNVGTDNNEFIEFHFRDSLSTPVSFLRLYLYDGTTGLVYDSILGSQFTRDNYWYDYFHYKFPQESLVNDKGGIAFSFKSGNLPRRIISFISYGGTFTPQDGPALGMTPFNLGIAEDSTTSVNNSISLHGNCNLNNFFWTDTVQPTMGYENQYLRLSTWLPVEMTYFKALSQNEKIQLNWQTAQELNNSGFEIQRSQDGENFEKIAWKDGNGNSQGLIDYEFIDQNVLANQTYFYRLKQIDFDGEFEYSGIVSAKVSGAAFDLVAYPNPAQNTVQIQFSQDLFQPVDLSIFSLDGKLLLNEQIQENNFNFDVSSLSAGIYLIKAKNNNQIITKRLVIQK